MKYLLSSLTLMMMVGCTAQEQGKSSSETPTATETKAEQQLSELGIELPEASSPVANYVNAVRVGKLLFLSGKGPKTKDGSYITGKVGKDLTLEEGREAAS